MKIATWNINSVRLRLELLLDWLQDNKPEVLALQEIKCQDHQFPVEAIEDLGYSVLLHGQKSYNGVAVLTLDQPEETLIGLPGDEDDEQARYAEVLLSHGPSGPIRLGGLYLPNGNPAPGPKYEYKLAWMKRLFDHAQSILARGESLVLMGDYNVIPSAIDCYSPESWAEDALFLPATRRAYQSLLNLGLTEALTATGQTGNPTFWDYQGGAWQKGQGIRIDHILLSADLVDCLESTEIDKPMREREKPSDHVPVLANFRAATD